MYSSECYLKVFGSLSVHVLLNTYPCRVYVCSLCPKFPHSVTCYQSSKAAQWSRKVNMQWTTLGPLVKVAPAIQESDLENRVIKKNKVCRKQWFKNMNLWNNDEWNFLLTIFSFFKTSRLLKNLQNMMHLINSTRRISLSFHNYTSSSVSVFCVF